jgi:uncharacterized DUF497 family protein
VGQALSLRRPLRPPCLAFICQYADLQRRNYNEGWRWSSIGTRKKPRQIWPNTKSRSRRRRRSSAIRWVALVADPRHSSEEERFVLLGLSQDQHLLAVMYVERGETIRIVSARRATRRERRNNEEIIH